MVFHLIQYASMALTPDDLKSIHTLLTNALKAQSTELKTYVDSRLETQSKELETHIDIKLQEQNETLDISFREIIEEKIEEKCNRGAEHDDDHRLWYHRVAAEIDEHPQVKNPSEDVRPDALEAVFHLHGLNHVERPHQEHSKNRHRKRGQENQHHQLPLACQAMHTELVGIDYQQEQEHVRHHEQRMEQDGKDLRCGAKHIFGLCPQSSLFFKTCGIKCQVRPPRPTATGSRRSSEPPPRPPH